MTDDPLPPDDLFSWRRRREQDYGRTTEETREILTISELTAKIKRQLESAFQGIWVAGEISNLSQPNSGHIYLTLKDGNSQLSAVLWRSVVQRLRFEPRDGMAVLAQGDITVYPPRGSYQIVIKRLLPHGMGALQLAFLQLKEKLEKEGLFDPEHKRPLPLLPQTIGIVTSPSGAAIRDILKQIRRRFPAVNILLCPVRVQGEGAAREIADAIRSLNEYGGVDVMIVGRGGGSIEDLWAFNEEVVARAIYDSNVPVISAVGHEIDVTISDLVADHRALTPTAAGEVVVPDRFDLAMRLAQFQGRLRNSLVGRVHVAHARLQTVAQATAFRRPLQAIRMHQQHIDEHAIQMKRMAAHWLAQLDQRAASLAGKLESLGPLNVLARGYSVTLKADGTVARRASELAKGDNVKTLLSEGSFISVIENTAYGTDGREKAQI